MPALLCGMYLWNVGFGIKICSTCFSFFAEDDAFHLSDKDTEVHQLKIKSLSWCAIWELSTSPEHNIKKSESENPQKPRSFYKQKLVFSLSSAVCFPQNREQRALHQQRQGSNKHQLVFNIPFSLSNGLLCQCTEEVQGGKLCSVHRHTVLQFRSCIWAALSQLLPFYHGNQSVTA